MLLKINYLDMQVEGPVLVWSEKEQFEFNVLFLKCEE